ncbi:nickel ABC transporter, periplasmic nickel-binding protein NikA [Klebsiella pneumoniae subsp. ozaenae]|uniref:Nickel ABC transporter, periplasmic nickel-binding protein NikA n=1 Tax=Klebsiella pneumoniae subsp. ozaenae TaxID=574 RepID=A0A378ANE1_KLEPO|nr:nickel ABC transporter, periplasmic nickel-binding protein NikA [Klebsiella pneumoniae subsp. ozaenae]
MSIIRLTLLALVACVPLLAQAAPYQLTTAWPVNVGPLNPHLYTPNQMFAQSMVYEPLVKYQADGSVQPGWQPAGVTPPTEKPGGSPCATMWPSPTANRLTPRPRAANFQAVLANPPTPRLA